MCILSHELYLLLITPIKARQKQSEQQWLGKPEDDVYKQHDHAVLLFVLSTRAHFKSMCPIITNISMSVLTSKTV